MSRTLKLYITTLVTVGVIALPVAGVVVFLLKGWHLGISPGITILPGDELHPRDESTVAVLGGVAFWTIVTAFASALPARMPRGSLVSVSIAPIMAAIVLGGPFAGGLVAALGTTEVRELRGRIPW